MPTARRTTHRLTAALDLAATLGPMRHGRGDPSVRLGHRELWWATTTPGGAATLHLVVRDRSVEAEAWGPGAEAALDNVPDLLGERDRPAELDDALDALAPGRADRAAALVRDLHRRHPGLRIPRTNAVVETLVPVILEQKVIGQDAWSAYRALIRSRGRPAPGPADLVGGLTVPPTPDEVLTVEPWEWHRWGVERRRATTVRTSARRLTGSRFGAAAEVTTVSARLRSVPGVGPWTVAEVARVALGDADAVSVGDYHLPNQIGWALAGRPRSDDAVMLELLEPFRGHRGRVIRLISMSGLRAPRYGPRLARSNVRNL